MYNDKKNVQLLHTFSSRGVEGESKSDLLLANRTFEHLKILLRLHLNICIIHMMSRVSNNNVWRAKAVGTLEGARGGEIFVKSGDVSVNGARVYSSFEISYSYSDLQRSREHPSRPPAKGLQVNLMLRADGKRPSRAPGALPFKT